MARVFPCVTYCQIAIHHSAALATERRTDCTHKKKHTRTQGVSPITNDDSVQAHVKWFREQMCAAARCADLPWTCSSSCRSIDDVPVCQAGATYMVTPNLV
jgi:hypothetical protein